MTFNELLARYRRAAADLGHLHMRAVSLRAYAVRQYQAWCSGAITLAAAQEARRDAIAMMENVAEVYTRTRSLDTATCEAKRKECPAGGCPACAVDSLSPALYQQIESFLAQPPIPVAEPHDPTVISPRMRFAKWLYATGKISDWPVPEPVHS